MRVEVVAELDCRVFLANITLLVVVPINAEAERSCEELSTGTESACGSIENSILLLFAR